MADVTSDRLELFAVLAGAGAEGSVFVAKGSDLAVLGVVEFDGDLVVVCAGSEDSVFAILGFDAGVESGGTGFELADVTSDRLELFAVLVGAGAEGSVFVAKGSDIIAGGSDGVGFDLADVAFAFAVLAGAGAGGSVFVAKGSNIIALGGGGCCGAGLSLSIFSRAATGGLASLAF